MHSFIDYLIIHKTTVLLGIAYVYVISAGTQPPLSPSAGYWRTWAYRFWQAGAANFSARLHPIYADPNSTTRTESKPVNADSPTATVIQGK